MADAPAQSSAPTCKDRRGWLIAFGIIEILLGLLSLLAATLVLVVLLLFKPTSAVQVRAGTNIVGVVMGVGLYSLIAVFFFVVGIGSIQRRNWARILMLIASGFWLVGGALGTAFMLFLLPKIMEAQHNVTPGAGHIVFAITISALAFFGALLPLVFLLFYSRKSVKTTCLAREAGPSADVAGRETPSARSSGRKLSVAVIILVVWEAFSALSCLTILLFAPHAAAVFGYVVRGWGAIAIMVGLSAFSAVAAWLIYRLRVAGWTIALLKILFLGASGIVSLANGSMLRLMSVASQPAGPVQMSQLLPDFSRVMMVGIVVFSVAYLVLLIYTRRFFVAAGPRAAF